MTSSDMSYSFRHLFFNSEKSKDNHYWDGHICSSSNNLVPKKEFKKVAHNVIERRYRNNINDRIQELKDNVPALYKAQISDGHLRSPVHNDHNDSDTEMIEGVEVAKKLNKATVLKKATEYIESLKRTQDKMSEENSILQNIISQMPNGPQVLSRFLYQKAELENAENQRLSKERQKAQEQARLDRKRVLRERAAERAALAQIIPKPERKPYKRRQQKKKSKDTHEFRGNRILMASFMCLVFFANLPVSIPPMICQNGKTSAGIEILSKIQYMTIYLTSELKIRAIFYSLISVFSILYMCLIPLVFCWLQPRPVKRVRSQLKLLCCFEEAMVAANCLCKTICNYVFYLFHKISFYSPIAYFGHEKERSTDKSYPNEESHFHVLNSNLGVITTSQMKQSGCKQNDLNNKKHHTILSSQLNLSPPPFLSTYFTQDCLKKIAGFPYKGWHIPKEDSTPANTQMAISRFKYHHFVSPNSVTNSHVPLLWQKIKE
ncbi:helix-loop-helix DNA-binding domain-containing protein [Sporodiniella umbellata]|nr:helix-loop-helix DNA-binding domain-containing protein [Sporodiniella umbellata]